MSRTSVIEIEVISYILHTISYKRVERRIDNVDFDIGGNLSEGKKKKVIHVVL